MNSPLKRLSDIVAHENGNDDDIDNSVITCKCMNVKFRIAFLSNYGDADESLVMESQATRIISSLLTSPKILLPNAAVDGLHGADATFSALVESKCVEGWYVYSCSICKTLTHISCRDESGKVLVNFGEMLSPSQQAQEMIQHANYCKLFGIICMPVMGPPPTKSTLKSSVIDTVRDVKDRAGDFLEEEKSNMQQRIREFESAQRAMYEDLESSVSVNASNLEDQIWAAFHESNDDVDSAFERSVEEITLDSPHSFVPGKSTRSSSAVDDMFELDPGFTFEDDRNDDIEDDIFSDDEDTLATPNYKSRRGNGEMKGNMAKSVPIPIMRPFRASVSGSFSDDETTPNPQDMQASMKALAQSVGVDGTEMFGDLPRSRFNTGVRRSQHGDY